MTVPCPVSVTMLPAMVAGPLVTTNVTGRPELAVGFTENAASSTPWSGTGLNVMDCGINAGAQGATTKLCTTVGAAANVALPAWVAVTTTVPVAPVSVTMLPEIVAGPLTASVTGRPELATGEIRAK